MQLGNRAVYEKDKRVVLTLDAGGTTLVFKALQGGHEITETVTLPSIVDELNPCLEQLVYGFRQVQEQIRGEVSAISFAFPGPADYKHGIIGDLPNLPAFRGGVALGPFLSNAFDLPVFINNDGNLFALGEFVFGFLPDTNQQIKRHGGTKQFKNLIGLTLGTGFGCGIVCGGQLLLGDNSNAAEIWLMRNKLRSDLCADAGVGKDKLRIFYAERSGLDLDEVPAPEVLYRIGKGEIPGDVEAACAAFTDMGQVIGDAVANAACLVDGLVVIGGGISGAAELFMPAVMEELNGQIGHLHGVQLPRMPFQANYLDDEMAIIAFSKGEQRVIGIPQSSKQITHDALPRIGVGLSTLGVSRATAMGAYVYALHAAVKFKE
ncbi:ROK family protein [Planctomycetota bacterium]